MAGAQFGVLLFAAYLWVVAAVCVVRWRRYRLTPAPPPAAPPATPAALATVPCPHCGANVDPTEYLAFRLPMWGRGALRDRAQDPRR
jgi:hypothetical protein